MPVKTAQSKSAIFKSLVGGLNVREAITDLADNDAAQASNITYYTAGALVRRGGWKKLFSNAPTSNALLGCFQATFNSAGTFTYYLVVTDGIDMWQCVSPTTPGSAVSWTAITGVAVTFDATKPYKFLMMANKMVFYNGVTVGYWTGAGNVQAMPAPGGGQIACPKSYYGIVWQNYLFWLGDATNPDRAYFSDLGDPTVYPSANFADVQNPFDGDQLSGAAILYGNLVIFKRFSMYVLQGTPPSNLILSKLNASVGCVEPASIVQADNLIYFVSDKGLYAANLFNVRQVCYKVEPRYVTAVPNSSTAKPIWAAHYKPRGQIFISINYGTYYSANWSGNDRIMCHDYFNADQNGDPAVSEFIFAYTNFTLQTTKPSHATAPSIMGDYFFTNSNPLTVMASFYDAYIYVMTEGSLGGGGPYDEIDWYGSVVAPQTDFLSKFFDFGDPDMIKTIRWVWTTGQLYNAINLEAGIVYNNSPTAVSFVDYNSNVVAIASPDASVWAIDVSDGGAISVAAGGNPVYLQTPVLADSSGQNWTIGVDNLGALTTAKTSNPATGAFLLVSSNGFQYIVGVDTDGAITTTAVFSPDLTIIVPGRRSIVNPSVGQQSTSRFGKYVQIYFTGIGVLSQFSFDLIFKGRRN